MRRELEVLQRNIQERNGEARQLQKQLTDLERDRHTEVVKLRLEVCTTGGGVSVAVHVVRCCQCYPQYDAKLLKLQKQNSKNQCGQSSSSSINHEIFRRVSIPKLVVIKVLSHTIHTWRYNRSITCYTILVGKLTIDMVAVLERSDAQTQGLE